MRKLGFFLILMISIFHLQGQEMPYKWKTEVDYLDNGNVAVKAICELEKGWHIYSINTPGGGPIATTFFFNDTSIKYELTEIVAEPKPHIEFDESFEVDVWSHEGNVEFIQEFKPISTNDFKFDFGVEVQACQDEGVCMPPDTQDLSVLIEAKKVQEESLLWLFWTGLIAGFLALLTPCVFPMIPMTVTFFTKMSESKSKGIGNAVLYGISIIVIYVLLGFGVTALVDEEALYTMASGTTFNAIFALVFLIFAISFLGFFEITLPASFANKMDAKADKGGIIGIFFMAFTLTIVSFSCTGPVVGTLLVEAAVEGGVKGPLMGMLGFGTALALPFTLFAIFPGWLNSLPKSGGWLNSVKVVLGLVEAALVLKFISNVDLIYQFGFIKREVFIVVWILIFLVMGIYLLGKIKFPHDSKDQKLSFPRIVIALAVFGFVGYLGSGLVGNSLNSLSGILPPTFYSIKEWDGDKNHSAPKHDYNSLGCPSDLNCFHNYDEALAYANKVNKPLLVDFTGWTCTNCRAVEQSVWTKPSINKLINEDFVLVSLYVDDKTKLKEDEVYVSDRNGKTIKTVGAKNLDMEVKRFGKLSQPLYVLLAPDESRLVPPRSYTLDEEKYKAFLLAGKKEFNKRLARKLDETPMK